MTERFTESTVESATLAWLGSLGWATKHGPEIAPDGIFAERQDCSEVVLAQRLRDALARLNPQLPAEALEDAFRKLTRPEGADLLQRNRALHRLLVNGVTVEYRTPEGVIRGAQARVIDFDEPADNDWLAVNPFTVVEKGRQGGLPQHRRPDVVLFVNGLPLAVLELKSAADALDPAILPGTSSPEVEGLTYGEAMRVVAETIRRNEWVGFDLVELAPNLDPSGLSALVGARLLAEGVAVWGAATRGRSPSGRAGARTPRGKIKG